jgi:hypothetical protein
MTRLLLLAVLISVVVRTITGNWPWYYLKDKPSRAQSLFRARKLLGLPEQPSRTEIIEAHKRLVAMVHPDRGGTNAQVHEANAARDLLLDELPDGV